MAEGRMLKRVIATSKKLSLVKTDSARLLYTWLLPFLDVNGCYYAEPEIIKGNIVPRLKTFDEKNIQEYLDDLNSLGLISVYNFENEHYLKLTNFLEHQCIYRDREAKPTIPTPELLMRRSGVTHVTACEGPHKAKQSKLKQCKLKQSNISKDSFNVIPQVIVAAAPLNKTEIAKDLTPDITSIQSLFNKQSSTNLPFPTCLKLLQQYSSTLISQHIQQLNFSNSTNPIGLLINSLKHNYSLPDSQQESNKPKTNLEKKRLNQDLLAQQQEQQTIDKQRLERNKIEKNYLKLSPKKQKALETLAIKEITDLSMKTNQGKGLSFLLNNKTIIRAKIFEILARIQPELRLNS